MGIRSHYYYLKHRKKLLDGVRVELLSESGEVVYRTATVAGGQFKVNAKRLPNKPRSIRFVDGSGKKLGEEKWSGKHNFKLSDRLRRPETLQILDRQNGPLLNIHHVDRVLRFVKKHGSDKSAFARSKKVVGRLLPRLDAWDDLVAVSAGVLDGDPAAIQRFRGILATVPSGYFGGRQSVDLKVGFEPDKNPRRCLLAPRIYEQLVIATQLSARTSSEYTRFFNNLDIGLAGIRTLERVINAATPLSDQLSPEQSSHIAEGQFDQLNANLVGLTPLPTGPDGGPPGLPPIEDFIPELDLCEMFRQQCMPISAGAAATETPGENDGVYRIDSVSPLPAAAGSVITITGVNFGPKVRGVRFPACGGGTIVAQPNSESETQVEVQVPEGATHGPISLIIVLSASEVCGNLMVIHEMGEEGYFEAASPSIGYLRVDADDDDICVESGDPITAEWFACPPEATVEVRFGTGLWQSVDNTGEQQLTAPPASGEITLPVSLRATTPAGSVMQSVDVRVVGSQPQVTIRDVEFTQGIQTMFRDDGTPDNSLALVANKDTVVRVYVDVDRDGFNNNQMDVTGEIRIDGVWDPLRPINNSGPFILMEEFSENDRTTTDGTLNFLIPMAVCNRPLELEITVVGDWVCDPKPSDTRIENISFRDVPAMGVRIRRIRGRAGNVPTPDEAMNNVINAFTYLPSPATNILHVAGEHDVSWLVGAMGGYDSDTGLWLLSQDVSSEHWGPGALFFDGNIWVGLTARVTRGIMAWPDTWTCISHAANTTEEAFSRTAHELCHCLDFGHVRNRGDETCNEFGLFDTTCELPQFEGPLPDVPFRVRLNGVITGARDLMGYQSDVSRFLNPEFWVRAMNEIDDRWN